MPFEANQYHFTLNPSGFTGHFAYADSAAALPILATHVCFRMQLLRRFAVVVDRSAIHTIATSIRFQYRGRSSTHELVLVSSWIGGCVTLDGGVNAAAQFLLAFGWLA